LLLIKIVQIFLIIIKKNKYLLLIQHKAVFKFLLTFC